MRRLMQRGQDPFTRLSPFARFRREGGEGGQTGSGGGSTGSGSGSGGGAPGGQPGGAGSPPAGGAPPAAPPAPAGGGDRTYTAAEMKAVREEAAANRVALKTAQEELDKAKKAQMTEEERKATELKEAQAKVTELTFAARNSDILAKAAVAGASVPQAIVGLVPVDAVDLDAAIAGLKTQFPQLFTARPGGSADGGGGSGTGGTPPAMTMNQIIRRASGRQA
jgi:hypothetical protein